MEHTKKQSEFERLVGIMDELRAKCPWDKKQTLESLSHLTIEEVYELYDAILKGNDQEIAEEVGDLFLHLVFYAKILNERNGTTVEDILHKINEKLIFRHPHVFGAETVKNEDEVKKNWEKLKMKEGRKSIFSGVPTSLPSVVKAWRIQDKAAQVGFEWRKISDVELKLEEELGELHEAVQSGDKTHIEEEMGDVLFTLINYCRFLKIDPEKALQSTNQKFINRFQHIEQHAPKPLSEMSLDEMEQLWQNAK